VAVLDITELVRRDVVNFVALLMGATLLDTTRFIPGPLLKFVKVIFAKGMLETLDLTGLGPNAGGDASFNDMKTF
jgi:hypothetical protein